MICYALLRSVTHCFAPPCYSSAVLCFSLLRSLLCYALPCAVTDFDALLYSALLRSAVLFSALLRYVLSYALLGLATACHALLRSSSLYALL